MINYNRNKTILKLNIYWMILFCVILSTLSFFMNITLGIIITSISVISIITYIIIGKQLKNKIKEKNETTP